MVLGVPLWSWRNKFWHVEIILPPRVEGRTQVAPLLISSRHNLGQLADADDGRHSGKRPKGWKTAPWV
jgi:hypothetical protein